MDIDHLKTWIGGEERMRDTAAAAPLAGLAALLDHETPPWAEGEVPPLGHWLYFLPRAPQSSLGEDGHPRRGGFLPPVPLPRRMWVGGELRFHRPVPIGAAIERVSTIANVTAKTGAGGEMVFVTVRHEVLAQGVLAIEERQEIVYRGPAASGGPVVAAVGETRMADARRDCVAGPVALFRFSALTFNGHRIHYDRDYACGEEGYPGLVVQGPLTATLLMDLYLRERPGAAVRGFAFRARTPLFDVTPFALNLAHDAKGADLWAAGPEGGATMTARVEGE